MLPTRAVILAILLCLAPLSAAPVGGVDGGDVGPGPATAQSGPANPGDPGRVPGGVVVGNGESPRVGSAGHGEAPRTATVDRFRVVSASPDNDTTEILQIPADEIDSVGFDDGDLDVGAAVGRNAGEARTQYTASTIDRRLRAADSTDQRREALRGAADRIDERIATLETRERSAVAEYSAGNRSGDGLVRTLATVDAEARELQDLIRLIHREHMDTHDSPLTDRELASYRTRLEPLHGPVRERIGDAAGGDDPIRIYVETGESAVTLAMVDDRGLSKQYVRESHVPEARDPDGDDQLGFQGARERFRELYPWASANANVGAYWVVGGQPYFHRANVYAVGVDQPHGFRTTDDLTTYIDGSTTDVFLEIQYKDPDQVPTRNVTTVSQGLRLEVNVTHAGGPMGVDVYDEETNERVDASVLVDGDSVGTTGGDGPLWTVGPRGQFTVNATHDGREVDVETALE